MNEPTDPIKRLHRIAIDTILIGCMLALVGLIVLLWLANQWRFNYWAAVAATFVLLMPGGWFVYAGTTIRHANGPVVKWSMIVASAQLAACAVCVLIAVQFDKAFVMSACGLAIFLPAQLALLYELWQARAIIRAEEAARGFNVDQGGPPLQAMPADAGDEFVGEAEIIPEAMLAPPKL